MSRDLRKDEEVVEGLTSVSSNSAGKEGERVGDSMKVSC